MKMLRKKPFNFVLVLLLVFANSGFASESINHGHGSSTHQMDSSASAAHHPMQGSHNHSVHFANSPTTADVLPLNPDTATDSDDCLCDELCCVSSVNLFDSNTEADTIPTDLNSLFIKPAYQSVTLTLPVPPPTA